MTLESPQHIESNDPDTPIRLLAAYRHIEFPTSNERTPAWEQALILAQHNLKVTIRFAGAQAEVLDPESEKYDTVMCASREAVEALLTVKAALDAPTPSDFHIQLEKLKRQYASIVGHIRHMMIIDSHDRPLFGFVEEYM
ncbi:MAG: hypothetical protein ACJ71W_22190 [Terriglobales bacterium]